jgi:hypothetical protein
MNSLIFSCLLTFSEVKWLDNRRRRRKKKKKKKKQKK